MNRSIAGLISRRFQLVQRALPLVLALVLGCVVFTPPAARAAGSNCTVNGAGGADYTTIQAAVDDTGCTTITVAVGTYQEHVTIARDVTISGAGASSTTIDGTNTGTVFTIPTGTVTLQNLTITNGSGSYPGGGGILNQGTLTVSNSTLTSNSTTYYGGGIANYNTLTVSNSTISGNTVSYNGLGGGIYTDDGSTVTVSNSTISGNSAIDGNGGAIYARSGTLTVSNSTFAGNSATYNGGGIYTDPGNTVTVSNSTISGNSAQNSYGGGFTNAGSATVINSTFADNSANGGYGYGGGIANDGTLTMSNTTLASNSASVRGGGIYNGGTLTMSNTTLASNSATYGGGIYNEHMLTVSNSIIANSASGGACYRYSAIPTDRGGNLADDADCQFRATTSHNTTDPKLDSKGLQDNGGPTKTIALLPGSPAIDAAVSCPPPATDQRGIARPQGAACDSGAYEAEVVADQTPPQITPTVVGTLGSNGWYTSDVTVSWSVVDAESTISSQTGCDTTTVTSDTNGVTFTCTATSAGGTSSQSITIKRDATAPTIAFASRTPANGNSWNNSAVSVIWTCSDAMSGANAANVSQTLTSEGANQSATGTCTDLAGNSVSDTQSGINIDTTAPSGVSGTPTTSPNASGWYNAPVTVIFSGTDTTSGIAGCTSTSYSGPDSVSATVSGNCTDRAGNTSAAVASSSFKYDATAPTLAPSVSPNRVLLNGSATASTNASDATSGIASQSCGAISTSSIGAKSVSCSATDQAGNTASANANYTVIYNFSGFFSSVANAPTLNQVSGGSSVALTFSLGGNQGLNILATNFPASRPIDCQTLAPLGNGSYQAANPSGKSGLTYNATTNQYTYSWKTDKTWANTCRQLDLKLIDGTEHLANFKFK